MANIKVKAVDSFHLNGIGVVSAKQVISLPEAVVAELVKKKLVLVAKGSKADPTAKPAKKNAGGAPENKMVKAAGENKRKPATTTTSKKKSVTK